MEKQERKPRIIVSSTFIPLCHFSIPFVLLHHFCSLRQTFSFRRSGGCNKNLLTSTPKIIPLRHIKNRQRVKPKRKKNEIANGKKANTQRACAQNKRMMKIYRSQWTSMVSISMECVGWTKIWCCGITRAYRTEKHLNFLVNASGHVGVLHFVIDRRTEYRTKSQCVFECVLKYNGNDSNNNDNGHSSWWAFGEISVWFTHSFWWSRLTTVILRHAKEYQFIGQHILCA